MHRTGRPFGHLSIDQLETAVRSNAGEGTELLSVLGELGFRKSPRAMELKSIVQRLLQTMDGGAAFEKAVSSRQSVTRTG